MIFQPTAHSGVWTGHRQRNLARAISKTMQMMAEGSGRGLACSEQARTGAGMPEKELAPQLDRSASWSLDRPQWLRIEHLSRFVSALTGVLERSFQWGTGNGFAP